jgi:hypothetical protein
MVVMVMMVVVVMIPAAWNGISTGPVTIVAVAPAVMVVVVTIPLRHLRRVFRGSCRRLFVKRP